MRGKWVHSIWEAEGEEGEGGARWWLWMLVLLPLEVLLIRWFIQRQRVQNRRAARPHQERRGESRGRVQTPIALAPEPRLEHEEAAALRQEVKEDDFRKIEGIGPKVNQLLHDSGIRTYEQLASQSEGQLRAILREANLAMINPGAWPHQAKLAAKGKKQGQ
ncbi:MAG TPA: hypothetical protein VIK64_10595 [Anaerolineales bacterium]